MRRAALALALLWPAGADAADVESLTASAQAHKKAHRYVEALALMEQAYAIDPAPELLNNVAYLLDLLGRYRDAHDTFLRVVAMPNTSDDLKAKDRERIQELEKKLSSAWLQIVRAPGQEARVDGHPWGHETEGPVLPGEHVVELRDSDGRTIQIERTYSVTGRRSDVPTPPSVDRAFTTLVIQCQTEVSALEIDRFELTLPIASDARIRIAKGSYVVRLDCKDRGRYAARVDATAREMSIPPRPMEEPPVVVMPPTVASAETKWPPLVVGGAGLVAVGIATGLLVSAAADRTELDEAVPMGEQRALITYPDAVALDDRRQFKANAGGVLVTVGAVAIVSGVVWYFISD